MSEASSIYWYATRVQNPFLLSLSPKDEPIIPNHNITWGGWVISNSTLFNTQWIDCTYPISGSYGRGPRYLFYALILLAVLERRKTWISGVALASVMTYSATAAIHAFSLVVDRTQMVSQFRANDYETVMVGGSTMNGSLASSTPDNWQQVGLWLPVLPMVWDSDCDAVLAIVGVAFLVIAPMQTWSSTFRTSEAKAVLLLWSLLLFIGLIFSFINQAYVFLVSFPQLRFCPLNSNDTLPLTNGGSGGAVITWNPWDSYQANRTVTEYFTNSTVGLPSTCIYPCFSFTSSLRDTTDIIADSREINSGATNQLISWLYLVVYFLVSSASLSSLTVFAIQTFTRLWKISKTYQEFTDKWKMFMYSRPFFRIETARSLSAALWDLWRHIVRIYAQILSPLALILFVAFMEYIIWHDEQGETFKHIGQWGTLAAAGLIFVAAIVDHFARSIAMFVERLLHLGNKIDGIESPSFFRIQNR